MQSRLFYTFGKFDMKTTLENLARVEENLRKYGVDTNDETGYYRTDDGVVEIRNLLFEQMQSVLRVFWNMSITICEVGEQVYDEESGEVEDFQIIVRKDRTGMSDILFKFVQYVQTGDESLRDVIPEPIPEKDRELIEDDEEDEDDDD